MHKNRAVHFIFQLLPFAVMIFSAAAFIFPKGITVESLFSYAPENLFLGVLFVLFLYILKSFSVFLPISVLYALIGIIYPILPAMAINAAGTFICITIGYYIGYFSISDRADKMAVKYPKLKKLVEKQRENEWFASFFLRVCPISCDMVSIYLGSVKMTPKSYFFAGMIGCVPGIISATLLGMSIEAPLSPLNIFAFSMVLALSAASYAVYKYIIKQKKYGGT